MRRLWTWISNLSTTWGLLPSSLAVYLTTAVWVGVMTVVGFAQNIPLFWIMLGLPLAGASIATLILRGSEWRERQRISDKISFEFPRVTKKLNASGQVEAIGLGFQIRNHATYAIDFELDQLETNLGDAYPPKRPYSKKRFSIPSNMSGWFDDHLISLANLPQTAPIQGKISFAVKYGVRNQLRDVLAKRAVVFIGFDEKGNMVGSNWQEIDA